MEKSVLAEPRHVQWASNLHSEYRSTYRWHEYRGEAAAQGAGAGAGVAQQPARQPPNALPLNRGPTEPAMPRRKKYPGVAYKTNELFEPAPPAPLTATAPSDRARSAERGDAGRAGRRSKSEGPRQPRWTDTVEPKATTALGEVLATKEPETVSTEYRNQFAWPKDSGDTPRKSISMGALKKAAAGHDGSLETEPLMNNAEDHSEEHAPKKYIEDYLWNGQKPGVQRKSTFRSALSALISTGEDRNKDNRKRYKSEYKKKFRPFSQYVYEASKGTFTKCRGSKGKAGVSDEGASERMLPEKGEGEGASAGVGDNSAATLRATGLQPLGLSQSDSWYREVLDLRKRAGEYKYRGWGTELAPDHLTQIYNKQIELWYQVSRRSSLSALSLASTDHKALPRDEKDSKESRNHSPKKFRSFKSAPHQSIHAKLQETKALERSPHKTSPQKQRKKLQGHSFDEGAVHEAAKAGEGKAEFKSPRRRPRSADPAPAHSKHLPNGHEPHPRPHKPSDDEPIPQRSASVAKEQYWDDSPVVKSPPEPTRVKSPEQLNVRSPDPVNWTVPLDTGKTFTVTQNVKSEMTPIHHQQMSPIRKKSESPTQSKRVDKTPTTPANLTPIDETRALDLTQAVNGVNGDQLTPENPISQDEGSKVVKKSIEATQIAPGVVDTTLVNDTSALGTGLTAAEVLDRARTRFDKFWGKKKENDNV